jgi:hypothetical protein
MLQPPTMQAFPAQRRTPDSVLMTLWLRLRWRASVSGIFEYIQHPHVEKRKAP